MKTNYTPSNVANLLTAAAYVRTETIINGTQAAKLDAMIEKVNELSEIVSEKTAWIADAESDGKNPTFAKRMLARYEAQFADAVANLRAWLVDFKTSRPNVNINLDDPETPNPDNTPTTMNANETTELGYNAATRAAMIDAARAFLVLADKLNEEVSAYIDGSNNPEAETAYNAVKDAEAVFLRYYCAYWDEPRRRPCLGYELAESSLPEDDEYFNGEA